MHLMSNVQRLVLFVHQVGLFRLRRLSAPAANSMTLTRKSRLISYPHPLSTLLQGCRRPGQHYGVRPLNYPKHAS